MTAPDWAYFVYYRLGTDAPADAPWPALFAAVREETGVTGRLYGPAPDGRTWMEVYEPVPEAEREAFEAALEAAVSRSGIRDQLAAGESRHTEVFPRAAGPLSER